VIQLSSEVFEGLGFMLKLMMREFLEFFKVRGDQLALIASKIERAFDDDEQTMDNTTLAPNRSWRYGPRGVQM
jgi:hypothetical protein